MKSLQLFFTLLLITPALMSAQEGRIVYLEGQVTIARGATSLVADFGTPLRGGDEVSTGSSSTAVIRTDRGAEIKLREKTTLRLDSLTQETRVYLKKGGLFSRIARLFNSDTYTVTTPSVAAGVRGTRFFIAYGRTVEDAPDVWLCVNEGSVAVAVEEGNPITVNEGEGVNILAGKRITQPRFFPWTRGLNWNTDPEKGEVQDTTDLDAAYSDLLDIDYD